MNISNPVLLHLIIDLVLLLAVIFLLWRVNTNLKKPKDNSYQEMINGFRAVVEESQAASESFLESVEKSRLAFKEIALELDLKEKRVRSLLDKKDEGAAAVAKNDGAVFVVDDKHARVVEMIKRGNSHEQTARETGFSEAEIELIIDLYRIKNETS